MTARNLRAVPKEPDEQPKDVTMLLRAEIERRDWSAMHVAADRRKPWRTMVWRG